MKRNYIGLSTTCHDSALAVVNGSGEVVFAEATERYLQSKRAIGVAPDTYLRAMEIVKKYGDPSAELVHACSWSERLKSVFDVAAFAQIKKRIESLPGMYPLRRETEITKFVYEQTLHINEVAARTLEFELALADTSCDRKRPVIKRFDHHLTHAATACYTSPYREGVCAIIDGFGEGSSTDVFRYREGTITPLPGVMRKSAGSLGHYYLLLCLACGFEVFAGEEWKVMGLAPYGERDEELYALLKGMFPVNGVTIDRCPSFAQYGAILERLHRLQRRPEEPPLQAANLACTGQIVFEEMLFQFLNNLYAMAPSKTLLLGGGTMLNSSAVGKIVEHTPFENVYVSSSPGDDGNAIGAALLAYHEDHPTAQPAARGLPPYLGSELAPETLKNLVRFGKIQKLEHCAANVHRRAAELLAAGKIIGWVQGRAEFGPRALGNRSILANPCSAAVKDEINRRVKFREEFRPFAPSILSEFGPEYFECYQDTPYMERTLRFKPEVVHKVPGVVHRDGTGRLQTVKKEWNEKYYNLIRSFYEITGVPVVLNTSFNVMGKPIIHSVEDAIAVFYTTGLDALVIDNYVIEK